MGEKALVNFSCRVKYFQALLRDPNLGTGCRHPEVKLTPIGPWFNKSWTNGSIGKGWKRDPKLRIYFFEKQIFFGKSGAYFWRSLKMFWFVGMICQGTSLQSSRPMPPDPEKRTHFEPACVCGSHWGTETIHGWLSFQLIHVNKFACEMGFCWQCPMEDS